MPITDQSFGRDRRIEPLARQCSAHASVVVSGLTMRMLLGRGSATHAHAHTAARAVDACPAQPTCSKTIDHQLSGWAKA